MSTSKTHEKIAEIFENSGIAEICRNNKGAELAQSAMIEISMYFDDKINLLEKQLNPSGDGWKERLIKERTELLNKTIKLKNHIDNPDIKHNNSEWGLLCRQFAIMQEYVQILTDRCIYYNLIPSGDLNLHY